MDLSRCPLSKDAFARILEEKGHIQRLPPPSPPPQRSKQLKKGR